MSEEKWRKCPNCGSEKVSIKDGTYGRKVYICRDCGEMAPVKEDSSE